MNDRKLYRVTLLRYVPELVEIKCYATDEKDAAAQATRAAKSSHPHLYSESFVAQNDTTIGVKVVRKSIDVQPTDM